MTPLREPIQDPSVDLDRSLHGTVDDVVVAALALMARGVPAPEVARRCNVAEATLRRRLAAAREQCGARTNLQLVVTAVRQRVI